MTALDTQVIGQTGTEIEFAAAGASGDTCATGEGVKFLLKNGSGASVTATLDTPGKVDGDLDIANRTFTVAAGEIGGISMTDRYRNKATGLASITYSATTTVTVAVIR